MARMANLGARALPAATAAAVVAIALLPLREQRANAWSIDDEPMGPGWHDSSWMLKKGLDVTEGVPPEAVPPEWQWQWWVTSGAAG